MWGIEISTGFYGTGTEKPQEIINLPAGNCLDGNADTKISSVSVWTGTGNQYFFRKLFGRDHGNDICTGTEKQTFPVQSRGKFAEQGPGKYCGRRAALL